MSIRQTHTYVILELSQNAMAEIETKLRLAGYRHVFGIDENRTLADMSGIAVVAGEPCPCGCCHRPDHGACPIFDGDGTTARCVYCDHGNECHERDKGRAFYNGPVSVGYRSNV